MKRANYQKSLGRGGKGHEFWECEIPQATTANVKSNNASKSRKSGLAYEEEISKSYLEDFERAEYYLGDLNKPTSIHNDDLLYHKYNGGLIATDRTLFSSVPGVPPVFTSEMKLTVNENQKELIGDSLLLPWTSGMRGMEFIFPFFGFTPDKDDQLVSGNSKYIKQFEGIEEDFGVEVKIFIDNRKSIAEEYGVRRSALVEHKYNKIVRPICEVQEYIQKAIDIHRRWFGKLKHPHFDF